MGVLTGKEHEEAFWRDGNIQDLDLGVYNCQNSGTEKWKSVLFVVCKLYINEKGQYYGGKFISRYLLFIVVINLIVFFYCIF